MGTAIRREFEPQSTISWLSNIVVPAALPIQILICTSKRMESTKLIVIGLLAHTCVEPTVRFAAELGY
jgi:ureidoacrylate peracid hydrolase